MMRIALLSIAVAVFCITAANLGGDAGTASDKLQAILAKIKAAPGSASWPSSFQIAYIFVESMTPTVSWSNDEFPSGRTKLIHSVGTHGWVKFQMNQDASNPYTGLFKGANYVVARCSVAAKFDATTDPVSGGFVPGCAFKFFRTNLPSANFVAMRKLTPSESWNFFKFPFSNHVSGQNMTTALNLIAYKFSSVSSWANMVGLSDIASSDENGNRVPLNQVNFPYQLIFTPNPVLSQKYPDTYTSMFDQFANVPVGAMLYAVWAKPSPFEAAVQIGKIVSAGNFVPSTYGDQTLFFRHQKMEEDLAFRPNWLKSCPTKEACPVCPLDVRC